MNSEIYMFVGPTAHGLDSNKLIEPECNVLPPVRRGDIDKLVETHPPAIAVIVDGTFHSYPSVAHKEINDAISQGWVVWGLSSMGAIRAAEMEAFGMHGYGQVYERYVQDEDFADDEVTLLHDVDYPFTPLSLPMIQIRELIHSLVNDNFINSEDEKSIVGELKNAWYGTRTKQKLHECLSKFIGNQLATEKLRNLGDFDLKKCDLISFLAQKPYSKSHTIPRIDTVRRGKL